MSLCRAKTRARSDLSLVISVVPGISPVLEVVEDLLLFGADGRREGLGGAVDRDGRRAQRAELADEVADGQAGAVLGLAGDGQGGEHDGQVRLDRVAGADEHGLCRRVDYADVSVLMPARAGYGGRRGRHNQGR